MHRLFISDVNLWRSKIWRTTLSFAVPPKYNQPIPPPPCSPPPTPINTDCPSPYIYYMVVAAQGF